LRGESFYIVLQDVLHYSTIGALLQIACEWALIRDVRLFTQVGFSVGAYSISALIRDVHLFETCAN